MAEIMNGKIALKIVVMIILLEVSNGREFEIIYDGFKILEGNDIIRLDVAVEKIGGTTFLCNATLKHFKPFDDNWKIHFEILHKGFDKTNSTLYYPSPKGKGVCDFLKMEYKMFFYETLKEYSNAPHFETCPLEPKEYAATNYPFDAEIFEDFLSPGDYEITMIMQHAEDVVKCKLFFLVL